MTSPTTDFIDVSSAQIPSTIDWPRVGASGIVGAYIRTGFGRTVDSARAAHAAGVKSIEREFGTYWYVLPRGGVEEAEAQATLMVETWRELGATFAPASDWEASAKESPLVANVAADKPHAKEKLADWIGFFLQKADALLNPVRSMIYTGAWWSSNLPQKRAYEFRRHALWVASYTRPLPSLPFPWDEYAVWQHSGNTIWSDGSWGPRAKEPNAHVIAAPGRVDGFDGEIDCNALGNLSLDSLRRGLPPCTPLDLQNIRDRQRALRRLGYDCGALDGEWGPHSRAALVLCQRDIHVEANGIWTPNTEWAIAEKLEPLEANP